MGRVGTPGHFNYCAEIKLRAERRAGGILGGMDLDKGSRPGKENRSHDVTGLADLGITRKQSHRWQAVAVKPPHFQPHTEGATYSGIANSERYALNFSTSGSVIETVCW